MSRPFKPVQLLALSFAVAISCGTLVLWAVSNLTHRALGFVDAFFTATSAVCVTGLTVVDTAEHFDFWGQLVVLILLQLGGLGIMTFGTFLLLTAGRRVSLAAREAIEESVGVGPKLGEVLRNILIMTAAFEVLGAVALFFIFLGHEPSAARAAWSAVFHSVSAFCNAGFSIYSDSLESYSASVPLNAVMAGLIVCGGIGFVVLLDLKDRVFSKDPAKARLSLHTKVVLVTTAVLIVVGAAAILALEWTRPAFSGMLVGEKVLAASFQSVTARTAGFNTASISHLCGPSLLLIMLLMFIGASPCSTGGGVKTSTLGTLVIVAYSKLRGKEEASAFGRSIPEHVIWRAVGVGLAALSIIACFALAVLASEMLAGGKGRFEELLFEVFSAFGTVGLSTGVTSKLASVSKLLICVLMFIGRVGPLSLAVALAPKEARERVKLPAEPVLVG